MMLVTIIITSLHILIHVYMILYLYICMYVYIQFWASVQREAYAADLFFYFGTWSMLALTAIFFYTSRYEDQPSAGTYLQTYNFICM